jgi:hypothetical protein
MISIIPDFDSVYQIRRRKEDGHPPSECRCCPAIGENAADPMDK